MTAVTDGAAKDYLSDTRTNHVGLRTSSFIIVARAHAC